MRVKKLFPLIFISAIGVIVFGFLLLNFRDHVNAPALTPTIANKPTNTLTPTTSPLTSPPSADTVCGWIDESDVIIKLTFADGVVKDTSYEAGFAYRKSPNSVELVSARLARSQCNYRTGFNASDFKDMIENQVVVSGYTDSVRRTLKNAPITYTITNSLPDSDRIIEVEVLD